MGKPKICNVFCFFNVLCLVERDEKVTKITNTQEERLQAKKKEAEVHKQRTMAMYDNMAKSAPAGDQKRLDTAILKNEPPKRGTCIQKIIQIYKYIYLTIYPDYLPELMFTLHSSQPPLAHSLTSQHQQNQ